MKRPKTKKLVNVKPHLREGKLVKAHKRLQETAIGVEQKQMDSIYQFNEVDNIISQNSHGDDVATSWTIIDNLFRKLTGSDVDEIVSFDFQNDIVHKSKELFSGIPAHKYPRELAELLSSKEWYKDIVVKVDEMEKILHKDFEEIERIDPFTIKVKHNMSEKEKLDSLVYDIDFQDSISELFDDHETQQISQIIRMNNAYQKYGPKAIKKHLYKAIFFSNPISRKKELSDMLLTKLNLNSLKEKMQDPDIEAVVGDPEMIRKHFKTALRNHISDDPRIKELYEQFGNADVKQLVISATDLIKNKSIPKYEFTKERLKKQEQLEQKIQSLLKDVNDPNKDYVYFSKNPLAFITISPSDRFASCQSIRDKKMVNVSIYNYNLLASTNLHRSGDWVVFMADNNGNKEARISLQYDGQKFKNWEENKVYGRESQAKTLEAFVNNYDRINKTKITYDEMKENVKNTETYQQLNQLYEKWINNRERDIVDVLTDIKYQGQYYMDDEDVKEQMKKIKQADKDNKYYDTIKTLISDFKDGKIERLDTHVNKLIKQIIEKTTLNDLNKLMDKYTEEHLEKIIEREFYDKQLNNNPSYLYGSTYNQFDFDVLYDLTSKIKKEFEYILE